VDFSPAAIAAARDIAKRAGLVGSATFVCASVDDAPVALGHATFDIVYVSLGSLCWLPDVTRWAATVAALLVPGGRLYLHDVHPLAWSLDDEVFTVAYSYFEESEPLALDEPFSYTDQEKPLAHPRSYSWNHSIGEVVNALIAQGLRITALVEHDWTVRQAWPWLVRVPPDPGDTAREPHWANPPDMPRIPLTFTLLAERPL
jgi:SAM-dependent methyltransferase